jgi:hypothetical protein
LKIPNTKRAGDVAQGVGPEFKPQYCKKTKKKRKRKRKIRQFYLKIQHYGFFCGSLRSDNSTCAFLQNSIS